MLKKHNKLIVFLVLAAFMFSVVGSAGAASFSDVTGTDVEANAIYKLPSLGLYMRWGTLMLTPPIRSIIFSKPLKSAST
jgi:hypothetical protein